MLFDLKLAFRALRKEPGFALAALGTIALTMALNAALFRLADTFLWSSPELDSRQRLVRIFSATPGGLLDDAPMAYPDFEDLRRRVGSLDRLAAHAWFPVALSRAGESELAMAEIVTGEYLSMLGVRPVVGRTLTESDDRPGGAADVAFLAFDAWHRLFAASPAAIGTRLAVNGRVFTVVGVAPRDFRGLTPTLAPDLWLPLHAAMTLPAGITLRLGGGAGADPLTHRAPLWVWVAGRLRPGFEAGAARAEVSAIAAELAREHPTTNANRTFKTFAASSVRLLPQIDRAVHAGSVVAFGIFGLVFLVGCLNLAGLALARSLRRRRELATRRCLGATRARLVRGLATEGLLLALFGGALGVALAHFATSALARLDLPLAWPLRLTFAPTFDLASLAFALGLVLVAIVVSSVLPAVDASRFRPYAVLRGGADRVVGSRRGWSRHGLVAAQVAIATVLLTGAALTGRSLSRALAIDPGLDPSHLATMSISPGLIGAQPAGIATLIDDLEDRIGAESGVESVTVASHLPLGFALNLSAVAPFATAGEARDWPVVDSAAVAPRYFETLSIPVVAGRGFENGDDAGAPAVAVINQTLAEQLWPGGAAIDRLLRLRGAEQPVRVVGVVRDGKYRTLGEAPRGFLYRPLRQDPRGTLTLVVRTAGDPRAFLPRLREIVRRTDPAVPVRSARSFDELLRDALLAPRLAAALLGGFGALALVLVGLGVFGVVSQLAAERRREIGLRLALGARPTEILIWAARRGLAPLAVGGAAGTLAAVATSSTLKALLYGLRPLDTLSFALALTATVGVGALAALLPAGRAAALDPAAVLRSE